MSLRERALSALRSRVKQGSLIANSFNLMLSAGVTALFGFVFWTLVARSFKAETIGLATTLLSMSGLISLLGLVGFDTVFVRFLPKSKQRNAEINNGMILSGIASALIAGLFCLIIPMLSPKLSFVQHSAWYVLSFIIFTVFTTWNTLTNAVLIAYRRTSFVVVINIAFSALKMTLPFIIHSGGPMTIFVFTGVAQVVNVILSIAALMKYFDYRPRFKLHFGILKEMHRYGMTMYFGQILNLLPDSSLPLIIVNELGARSAAYFYIAFTIANLVYTVAFSTAQALLAEVSHDEAHFMQLLRKGLLFTAGLLVPTITFIVIFSPFILSLFGQEYKRGAVGILRIMSVAGLAVMIGALINFVFKQKRHLVAMLVTTAVNSVAVILLSVIFMKRYGLPGVGWAFVLGGSLSIIVGVIFIVNIYNVRISKSMLKLTLGNGEK